MSESRSKCCSDEMFLRDGGNSTTTISDTEHTVLQIARCYFQSFAVPQGQAWLYATSVAEYGFASAQAPMIAARVLDMVQGMRVSRRSNFQFSNPFCAHCSQIVTPHERLMMLCLAAYRAGRKDQAEAHALLLCEGNPMERFLIETQTLAAQLPYRAHEGR